MFEEQSSQQTSVTADQQSQKRSYKECDKCKAEGKSLQMIYFEKAGMRGDGGIIWKTFNVDGTEHNNHPFAKKEYKRSVWGVRGIRSGDESQVNQWLREQKENKNGYFDVLGTGYFGDSGPNRMFDLVWKEKIE